MLFNFRTEIHDVYYYITVNVTILCYYVTFTHVWNIQVSKQYKECLMENLGYSSAA